MRRNNGVIGQKKLNSKNSATGIFDLYDQSNEQFDLKWPQTKKYYSYNLTSNDAAGGSNFQIIQNGIITLTMRFTGYEVGDSVYIYLQPSTNYVTGTYSSVYDFTGNKVLSASGLGNGITETTFNMQVRPNGGTKTIYWSVYAYTDSSRTRLLGSVGTFSALPPNGVINSTYSILNESASPNTDTPTVTISYVKNNISVWKTWAGTASLTTDVSGASTSNRTQTWSTGVAYSWDTITVLNDRLTESQETLIMYLRYANSAGHILNTKTWTINDDSKTWSAIVSESGNTMSETTSPAGGHLTMDTFGAADASRATGTYTGVTGSSSGTGTVGTFDIAVDGTGAVTSVLVVTSGSGHTVNDTITIADSALGSGGGAAFTMDVATIATGNSITFTVSTEYADVNPPTIDWDLEFLSSVTGSPYFTTTDLLPFETSGTLTLTNNVGSINVFANNDLLTEGDETFRLRVFDDIGNVIANSNVITILDTSTGDNEYVPPVEGQIAFTVAGTTNWVVPTGVTSVSAVCVGGGGGGASSTLATNGVSGGGGGGGALHWRTFSVTPGETLTVVVGAAGTGGTAASNDNATNGGESAILRTAEYLVRAAGGAKGPYNSISNSGSSAQSYFSTIGGGGGNGGLSSGGSNGNVSGGGGGAGGYSGNGGNGHVYNSRASTPGLGGGGSGAQGVNGYTVTITWGAGGVDIYGEGTSGTQVPGTSRTNTAFTNDPTDQAQAGSYAVNTFTMTYGGGGSGAEDDSGTGGATGGQGAVRIIWGTGRSYPSTSTADV